MGITKTLFPLFSLCESECHEFRSLDVQQVFTQSDFAVLTKLGFSCTNIRNRHNATTCYRLSHLTNNKPKLSDYLSVVLFLLLRENVQLFTEVEDLFCLLKECI